MDASTPLCSRVLTSVGCGSTATDMVLVWMRPLLSVLGNLPLWVEAALLLTWCSCGCAHSSLFSGTYLCGLRQHCYGHGAGVDAPTPLCSRVLTSVGCGSTATDMVLVWMRPLLSVLGYLPLWVEAALLLTWCWCGCVHSSLFSGCAGLGGRHPRTSSSCTRHFRSW